MLNIKNLEQNAKLANIPEIATVDQTQTSVVDSEKLN
jgi:hypothetical protein